MKRLLVSIGVVLLLGSGLAQTEEAQIEAAPQPLTLEQAVAAAPEFDAEVLGARADLSAAERDLARVEADPLSLRLDKLEAEQAVAAAQEALDSALLAAQTDVTDAYFAALEAEDALGAAQMARDIAATTLEATGVKYDAGAATSLELSGAQNDLAAAERDLADALAERDLALGKLGSLLGTEVADLAPVTAEGLDEAPDLAETLSEARSRNAGLGAAERAVELAQVGLAAVDNAFSARAEIDAAVDRLESARTALEDARRSLDVGVRQSYTALLAARSRYASALETFETSAQDLEAQQARLEAGSISPLVYQQTQLSHNDTAAALHSALFGLRLAALSLAGVVSGP